MATPEQVEDAVRTLHGKVWEDWYSGIPGVEKAELRFSMSGSDGGYSPGRNLILVSVLEGNLGDYDILNAGAWPVWKRELVHEMLHELDHKLVKGATRGGIELCRRHGSTFFGAGHGDTFFTAVTQKARYFGMSPEQLVEVL